MFGLRMFGLRRDVLASGSTAPWVFTAMRAAVVLLLALLILAISGCKNEDAGGSACEAGRRGPYATQDTAWQRWREAQAQGFAVSNGVFPCWDQGTRGYCFNVFCD